MATINELQKNNTLVTTPYGLGIVTVVDIDSNSVRVQHLIAKTPITDFKLNEIKLASNIKIKPNTKSNYLDLNGKILFVKEYAHHAMAEKSRITCSVFHSELNKIVDIDFTRNEIEFISDRMDGYYWVMIPYESKWVISLYNKCESSFYFTNGSRISARNILMIDENKIERKP
jgi:hypothetical protein